MIAKFAGALGLAAVLAAGPALASPPGAEAAAKPGYVGIVISGHGSYCVKWTSGITGDTVLNKVARVAYRNDGLIVQIDGAPSSGTADATHFWSYWHDTAGTWTYSSYGASGSYPKAGTVEGWSFDNGRSSAPAPSKNPAGLYASMCAKFDSSGGGRGGTPRTSSPPASRSATPSPRTTPSAAHHRSAATSTPGPGGSTAAGTAAGHPRASSTPGPPTPSRTAPTASSGGGAHPSGTGRSTPASGTPAIRPASSAADVEVVGGRRSVRAGTVADSSPASKGSPVGLIVGVGLVLLLGAGAVAVGLRRRSAGG